MTRTVRAVYRACAVPGAAPPYDNVSLKVFYPAVLDDSDEQRNTGVVAADPDGAPFPLVVFMPGINVGPESYAWLARQLAMAGIVTVTYTHVAEEMPGYISLTPGLDIAAIGPDTYGTRPSATVLASILEAMRDENDDGVLRGAVDMDNVVLAGHSGGGSVAIMNADPAWFPGLRGAFSYGAHSAAATVLGYNENTILKLPRDLPLMLVGGTRDGVIANSAKRYGDGEAKALERLRQTYIEGIQSHRGDCYLFEIEGANHFSIAWPQDDSTGRAFLDWEEASDNEAIRELIGELLVRFVRSACNIPTDAIDELAGHALVAAMSRK